MEHLKLFVARINIPNVGYIWSCQKGMDLNTLSKLSKLRTVHISSQDNTALLMIEHYPDAWGHNQFKDAIVRATNIEM